MIHPDLSTNMNAIINCPGCGEPVAPGLHYCEHCGVDLAVAALLAEQQAMLPFRASQGIPISPELLVPRIGDILIERKLIQQSELQTALVFQKLRATEGKPVLLGQALLEMGMITKETLDQVVTVQILQLQNALSEVNQSLKIRVEERTRELRQALEKLAELNQLKSNFIANISHELRTPLTHIKGYLDLLADSELGAINNDQQEVIEVIRAAENRLEQLIDDLIQFSIASHGDLSLNLHEVDAEKLVEHVVERSRNKTRLQEIQLEVKTPTGSSSIYADGDKLAWVLLQILDNAIKFTPKGGQVNIEVIPDSSQWVRFVVSDTGIGIPEERLDEIFEPFHQLDGSSTRRYPGTGLGLAMVKRIIEAHGSQIQVHSTVGKGSRFAFCIPAIKTNCNQARKAFET